LFNEGRLTLAIFEFEEMAACSSRLRANVSRDILKKALPQRAFCLCLQSHCQFSSFTKIRLTGSRQPPARARRQRVQAPTQLVRMPFSRSLMRTGGNQLAHLIETVKSAASSKSALCYQKQMKRLCVLGAS
jgi:hypothetical protein